MFSSTTSPEFFEAKYQQAADPWNFAASPYELNRYSDIIASLKSRKFQNGFEAGCSVGVLTHLLAFHCQRLCALDVSYTAVSQARDRCCHLDNTDIRVGSFPDDIPAGSYDLIVLSEIGYYFNRDELLAIAELLSSRLRPEGLLLAAHWLGYSADHLLSGDQVHELISGLPDLKNTLSQRHPGYRIDHWTRA